MVQETEGLGSGVIISSDGYIVTNAHVVSNVTEAKVTLNDGREFVAKVVGSDQYTDIAVLKVEATGLPAAKLADSDYIRVGELAVAIGNPYGFDHTVSAGVISALNRSLEMDNGITMAGVIQTDAPINPGNSGGALVSSEGLVIGINTAIYEEAQNIGFAIPIKDAMAAADEIIKYGKVRRAYIGLAEYIDLNEDIAARYGLDSKTGVMIYTVDRTGPLALAGLVRGDIIVEMNGKAITSGSEIRDYLAKAAIGGKMSIVYLDKDGKQKSVELTLVEMP
jgi:S1-C subfamily serine protease